MQRTRLSDQLRDIARIGIVNHKTDTAILKEAARHIDDLERKCEEQEERIAIMAADMEQTTMDALAEIREE